MHDAGATPYAVLSLTPSVGDTLTVEEVTDMDAGMSVQTTTRIRTNHVVDEVSDDGAFEFTAFIAAFEEEIPDSVRAAGYPDLGDDMVGSRDSIIRGPRLPEVESAQTDRAQNWAVSYLVLPEEPIGIGARWAFAASHTYKDGENITFEITNRLAAFDTETITVEVENSLHLVVSGGQEFRTQATGTITYDRRFGVPIRGVVNTEHEMFRMPGSSVTTYTLVP